MDTMSMTDADLGMFFAEVDLDGSGQIQKNEFINFMQVGERRKSEILATLAVKVGAVDNSERYT